MATLTPGPFTFDTNSGTKTAAGTPAVGDLLIVVVANSGAATPPAAPTVTDDNPDGLGAYTEVSGGRHFGAGTGPQQLWVFVRNSLVGSATLTTVTMAPGTTTGGGLVVLIAQGMTKTGAAALVQTAGEDNLAAGVTPAPSFAAAAQSGNPTIAAVFVGAANAMTPPSGWTERRDLTYATPGSNLEVATRDSGFTGTTITWGSATSGGAECSVIVELDASGAATQINGSVASTAVLDDAASGYDRILGAASAAAVADARTTAFERIVASVAAAAVADPRTTAFERVFANLIASAVVDTRVRPSTRLFGSVLGSAVLRAAADGGIAGAARDLELVYGDPHLPFMLAGPRQKWRTAVASGKWRLGAPVL